MESTIKETKVAERSSILVDKKVKVTPIIRGNSWLHKGHDGEFMYTGCKYSYCLPYDLKRGKLYNLLNKEEQTFFENELFLKPGDLSIYKKEDNFWHKFRVDVDKNGISLDLSDVIDNLRFRLLSICPSIATSWSNRFNSGEFKFALVDNDVEIEDRVKIKDKRKKAYKFLGSIENNWDKMYDFLKVFGRKPASNASKDFLQTEIDKIIEDNSSLDSLISIIEDKNYEIKVFIEKALQSKALNKTGKTQYSLPGGDVVGSTLENTIEYLLDPKNQDIYLTVKAQIESVK